MENRDTPNHHRFLAPAQPFEPPIVAACSAHEPCSVREPCRGDRRNAPVAAARRRRPFPRSLGDHAQISSTRTNVGPYSEPQVPDDVRRGAEQALRLLLEVLDRRRAVDRLGKQFAPTVVESVRTLVKMQPPGRRLGSASLRRVHVSRTSNNAAEVFGTYARGPRIFAVAARLEYRTGSRRAGWTVTSLRIH